MWMGARVRAGCFDAWIAKPAMTGAIRAISHIQEMLIVGRGGVHSSFKERVLADQFDVLCCAWSGGIQQLSARQQNADNGEHDDQSRFHVLTSGGWFLNFRAVREVGYRHSAWQTLFGQTSQCRGLRARVFL